MSSVAINVTITGLAIVFGTLIALVFIIWGFGKIMDTATGANKKPKAPKTEKPAPKAEKPAPKAASVPASAPAAPAASVEDEELIAVISAAVALMYEGTGKTPVIRAVRPASGGGRPAWAAAGIVQNTKAF